MNRIESKEIFDKIFENKLNGDEVRKILISLYENGESGEEIAGAMESMKNHSLKVVVDDEFRDKIIDNCGTGGDKSGSFNVSTTVSFVLAGAGSYVAKHGNRSITSRSGSGDVLEKLGFNLNLSPMQHAMLLQNSGFTFMFAPHHHLAMKYIMPIRKSISHRTIFNILGPLTNPANVRKQLIGVFSKDFLSPISEALKLLNMKSAIVVSGRDGMDEASISDISDFISLKDGKISHGEIDPQILGLKKAPFESIKGGDADENAKILLGILKGEIDGAKRDIVLLNSALALFVDGVARDFQDGIEIAKDSLDSGKAYKKFKMIIEMSQKI
jgi:anthranilate phosphoribosyltransferase